MPNVKPAQNAHYAHGPSYTLPVCDVQRERRNFDGYKEYENMLPLTDEAGTTDTDVKTHGNYGDENYGYTRIYGGSKKGGYINRELTEVRKPR